MLARKKYAEVLKERVRKVEMKKREKEKQDKMLAEKQNYAAVTIQVCFFFTKTVRHSAWHADYIVFFSLSFFSFYRALI